MAKIIEAKAVISAEDRTGAAFDSIGKKFKSLGKGAKVSAEVDRLGKSLERMTAQHKAVEVLNTRMQSLAAARTRFREAQAAVDGAAKAVAAAGKPTRELEGNLRRARAEVTAAAKAFEREKDAALGAKAALSGFGGATAGMVRGQTQLAAAIDRTSAALQRQARNEQRFRETKALAVQRRAERIEREAVAIHAEARRRERASGDLIEGMGGAGRRESARIASSRYLIDGMSAPGRASRAEREETARQAAELKAQHRAERRDAIGTIGAGIGLATAHKGKQIGLEAINAAGDMDYAVRYQHIATDVSEEDQRRLLIPQAKRIGQETKFSNLDVVKAQTATMQGLPYKDPAMRARVGTSIVDEARNYAVVLDSSMTEAGEGIRSFLQNTNKDISTAGKAAAEAKRATNLVIKAAKLGGMNNDDAQQFLKFGLPTATQAGFSDVTSMALGALARRSGLKGDEAGVFLRAASSKLISPTKEGREAEIVAGIDRSKYQTMPDGLNDAAFEKLGKSRFGVAFSKAQKERLNGLFKDGDLIADREEFIKRTSDVVGESFDKIQKGKNKGKNKAQDAAKIAKLAADFHKMSVESTDVEGLLREHMNNPRFTAALRNKFYTDKHGGKAGILAQHFDQFADDRAELDHVTKTPDFGSSRAKYMTEGLGGALDNVKGSYETAILSLGEKNAPAIKAVADGLSAVGDTIANLPDKAVQAGTAIGLGAGAGAGAASFLSIMGKLTGSTALAGMGATTAAATATGGTAASGILAGALASEFAKNTARDKAFAAPYLDNPMLGADPAGYGLGAAIMHADSLPKPNPDASFSKWWGRKAPTWLGGSPADKTSGGTVPVEVKSLPADFTLASKGTFEKSPATGIAPGSFGPMSSNAPHRALDGATSLRTPDPRLDASTRGPLTAEVKPDQITARIDSIPPVSVSGDVSGQATVTGSFTIEPSQWFVGKFNGLEQSVMQLSGKVASLGASVAANGPGSTGKSSPDAGKGSRD